MRRHLRTIFSLFVVFSLLCPARLWAGYSDPEIKVLLLNARGTVSFSSRRGIEIFQGPKTLSPPKRIKLRFLGPKQVQVGHLGKVTAPFYLVGEGPILLNGRLYQGELEIRPHKRGFYVINHIPVEKYLEGVLNAEISSKWNLEVVKAQAILARTYALKKAKTNHAKAWHLEAGHLDQVYQGAGISDARSRQALRETKGLALHYQGRLAEVFYHSNCGGTTEEPGNLWAYNLPYYSIKEVPFGLEDPNYYWQLSLSQREMRRILKKTGIRDFWAISVEERNDSNRVQTLLLQGENEQFLPAKEFRRLVGYRRLKSLHFDLIATDGGWLIQGQGNGHGVGMCQWAAKEMAEMGYQYQDILYYFYDGVDIEPYGF